MKKILPIFIISILLISGIGTVAISEDEQNLKYFTDKIIISEPFFEKNNDYLNVDFKESTSKLMIEGNPIIPKFSKVITLPFGTEITNINIEINQKDYFLTSKIQPSPQPMIISATLDQKINELIPNELIYNSNQPYPLEPYSIRLGAGLKDDQHVIYVNIHFYAQYIPSENIIKIPENIKIDLEYIPPANPLLTADEYDMLIITDEKFESDLNQLVSHKNNNGIRTIMETVQEILPQYDGRDDAEDVKLRIKDAIEDYGIKYVLLAGGRKGQTFDWYVPSRRTNLDDGSGETGYESDLYFSDIYKYDGSFDDWDSNGNGVFAEFSISGLYKDYIDYYPDVYVGRIPLRFSWETDIIVDKIITYENSASDSWFKNAYVISGDTSPPARDTSGIVEEGVYEGEISTSITANLLENIGFSVEKLFTSDGSWDSKEDVTNAFSSGSGFIHFAGHGNPYSWVNFLPDAQLEEEKVDGFNCLDFRKYTNGNKLPIVIIGGCHNGQMNVTMQNLIVGLMTNAIEYLSDKFWYMEWIPADTGSWMLLEGGGGSIASIANTGLGYGYINEFCTEGLGGWINPRFFHAYANQNKEILGETHSQAIIDYLNIIYGEVAPQNIDIDRKTIEEWILLGDPSLRIGGI